MRRVLILGTGTGVGKTWASVALLNELRIARGLAVLGSKPIESGIDGTSQSDASKLAEAAQNPPSAAGAPLFGLRAPISPHAAARAEAREISLRAASAWLTLRERTLHAVPHGARAYISLVETAGGIFTPLAPGLTNFHLARALDPAIWVLIAPDSLGVLSELSAALIACKALGREPDFVALCAARTPDASTGTNAHELKLLGIVDPIATLERDRQDSICSLADAVLR